jgi:hypothetical protein
LRGPIQLGEFMEHRCLCDVTMSPVEREREGERETESLVEV